MVHPAGPTPAVLSVKVFDNRAFLDAPTRRLSSGTEKCSRTMFNNSVNSLMNSPRAFLFSD